MITKMTCIECPQSCALTVDGENCRFISVSGNQCPKGEAYAKTEIENPLRILTGVVVTRGLALKMIPVRTDKPIPKAKIIEAAAQLRKMRMEKSPRIGDIIVSDFMGLKVNLIATRDVDGEVGSSE